MQLLLIKLENIRPGKSGNRGRAAGRAAQYEGAGQTTSWLQSYHFIANNCVMMVVWSIPYQSHVKYCRNELVFRALYRASET